MRHHHVSKINIQISSVFLYRTKLLKVDRREREREQGKTEGDCLRVCINASWTGLSPPRVLPPLLLPPLPSEFSVLKERSEWTWTQLGGSDPRGRRVGGGPPPSTFELCTKKWSWGVNIKNVGGGLVSWRRRSKFLQNFCLQNKIFSDSGKFEAKKKEKKFQTFLRSFKFSVFRWRFFFKALKLKSEFY